MICKLFQVLFW